MEANYREWIFAGLAICLYIYIWLKGVSSITDKERRKRK